MPKLIRITTVPISLHILLKGQLKFISQYYEVIAISSNGPLLERVSAEEQVKTYPVNLTREITPVKDLIALYRLYVYFKKEKPEIVHTHTPKAGLLGMIAAKWAGVPIRMHTVAGLPILTATGVKKKVLFLTEWITNKCATYIYPNSFKLAEIIVANKYCRPNKIRVIGNGSSNGINVDHYDRSVVPADRIAKLKTELNITDNNLIFCFVGRIVSDKGINELVLSFVALQKKYDHIKLLLVGPFEDLDPLDKENSDEIHNNSDILYMGYQEDIRPYLCVSNVFVFPSYREGFPNVVMQAGAMSLPCIVTNINGCNEIIQGGVNGLIVPPQDQTALCDAMDKFVTDKQLAEKLSKQSRATIVERYSQQFVWNELLKEYKRLEAENNA